ncbi:hypothetical protein [Roseovarius sp. Pro17]|uniref:hypothetical protein n=1 Tax=Roseovarius sp. Pro17 TaxID=3108175 RepID=UPI002D76CF19|nr:hypothetical protein [Roseovarius sp. Pro17]
MLAVAKLAKASNEILYRLYDDKCGLFEVMAPDSVAAKTVLEQAIAAGDDPADPLERFSPVFLEVILGERAI